ncbi:hypothetical protein [Planosporangium mesophilum]|uniref:Thrombospondin n=1 Tax=Planosporangium mesophilum TaxID=689768 RepID=A0A8J3TBE6_9ACTN|nr:hypothetical protein [Planosporangium mesophilum]NJC83414.1 hypothetical protein [Planosporangium mesophilum]GII21794.1 hypothetical protein Pme01_13910 [Planosporangium mesophilum]
MATGLDKQQTRDGRDADQVTTTATTPDDAPATGKTAGQRRYLPDTASDAGAVDGVRGAALPRHQRSGDQPVPTGGAVASPVPPGGAVAPVPPGGAVAPVPPGGAVAAPAEQTRRLDPVRDPVLLERGSTATERDETAAADRAEVAEPVRWARTSFTATLSLIIGVTATLAALSGRLAPVAIAVGVLGLLFAAAALTAVSRRHVTGHHVALFGLVFSIAGVVFGILAINKSLPWLNGGVDQAAALRDWLNAHLPWLSRW